MADENRRMHEPLPAPESGEADIRTRALVGGAGVAAWFLVRSWAESGAGPEPPARTVPAAGPVLQISPARDMAALRAKEDLLLRGTAWIDRDQGLARIPVETAMELLVKRAAPPSPRPAGPGG